MQPSQQMCWKARVGCAVVVAQPGAGVADDIELAVGVVGLAVAAGLVVRAGAFHGAVVLRHVEIDGPGTQRGGHLRVGVGERVGLRPVEIVGQQASSGAL